MAGRWARTSPGVALATFSMAALMATIAACTISGSPGPQREPSASDHRLASNHPGAFPHRLNPGNNGTPYEPCIEANRRAVDALGWDWSTRHDAATVDKQSARGCDWLDKSQGSIWGLSQIVGNSPSLDAYRRFNHLFGWLPDEVIAGRRVGVFTMGPGTCVARVQSGRAGVNTIVDYSRPNPPPISEICARAIDFTRATIARMPE